MATTLNALLVAAALSASPEQGIVLEFSAAWCGPCQRMSPIVAKLEREGLPIRKVDVDKERELARRYGVQSIPTFVLVVDGKVADRVVGMTTESQIRRLIDRIPKQEAAPAAPARPAENMILAGESSTPPVRTASAETTSPDRRKTPSFWPFGRKDEKEPQVVRANIDDEPAGADDPQSEGPLSSTARLRVSIDGHVNLGTGTIVDSRPGRTIIVTCGHIFRSMNDDTKVEVDLFAGDAPQTYVGRVLKYDLKADVGLVVIPTDEALPATPVAGSHAVPTVGDRVVSIGCSGGQLPSREQLRVTAINKYEGPDNIECTGVPVQGRSGGGLFDADGHLVGVCIAADTRERRGLYAGLLAIHNLLGESGLAELYEQPAAPAEAPAVANVSQEVPAAPARETLPVAMETQAPAAVVPASAPQSQPAQPPRTQPNTQPAGWPADLANLNAGDAEVVVIIRSKDDPSRTSRVVIINEASPKFYSYLQGEIAPGAAGRSEARRAAIPRRLDAGQALNWDESRPAAPQATMPLPNLRPTTLSQEFAPRRYVRSGSSTK